MIYPKLRNIEAFPFEHEGDTLICLRDPAHIAEKPLFFTSAAQFILSRLDGTHAVPDIQAACSEQLGYELPDKQIHDLIKQLDDHLFLDSAHFRETKKNIEQDFYRADCRQAAHAGTAYDADPQDLNDRMAAFFSAENGPGPLQNGVSAEPVSALIAPHIDFHRGGHCYAWAYHALYGTLDADIYLILGIGHSGLRRPFAMTMKDFSTPFGIMKTDRAFVEQVQAACPFDVMEDEFHHKNEHSVEFQVVFLQYLLQAGKEAAIVPVLCGSFHNMVLSGESPMENAEVGGFIQALKKTIDGCGKRVCVIAGVDLAHVGTHFGDQQPLTEPFLDQVRQADLKLLKHAEQRDAEALFQAVCKNQDRYRVCGYPAIYTMLSVVETGEGRLLHYDQAADQTSDQAVTFAGMAFN